MFVAVTENRKTMTTLKQPVMMASLIVGSLLFVRCANTPEEQRDNMENKMEKIEDKALDAQTTADNAREWENERNEVLEDLRDLRGNIDDKLAETNEDLAKKDLKASKRAECEAMQTELMREKEVVDGQIAKVEAATPESWDMTRTEADKAASDVKAWWEKQKENVDRKTDADNDHDGH